MEELDSLLAHLEATGAPPGHRHPPGHPPVLLTDPAPPPKGVTRRGPPGGDPPARPPPPPYGPDPRGDTEQLYSSVQKGRPPPRPPPAPPGLGELERLLRDLDVTHGAIAEELLAQRPPLHPQSPEGARKEEEVKVGGSPPRGGPPKSATQELDRLMASLSDFRPTPPQKKGVPPEGEEKPELPPEELGRRGVPGAPQNPPPLLCGGCRRPVVGKKVVTALGHTWHPQHFRCAHCGRPLAQEGFLEKDGQPYCREDFAELFSSRCQGCGQPILETFVAALQGLWHPQCFVCRECLAPFPGGTFYEEGGHPYCERHAAGTRGAAQRCGGCGETIEGGCVTALGQRFHPHHFVCAFCRRALAKTTFQEQEGKAYCPPCFRRLFG